MCIIVYKPANVSVDISTLFTCNENNPDGAGYMFPCEGRLLIRKGYFEFDDFHAAWEKTEKIHGESLPVVFHFRIATSGRIDKENCHPHRITRDLGMVHNGILSCVTVPKHGMFSDTVLYRNRYLGNMKGSSLHKTGFLRALSRHIGTGNKFAFMNGQGKVTICNEDQGVWKDGLWFSNYSFLSRNPFAFFPDGMLCEYCGKELKTCEELTEGACLDCLNDFESSYMECSGCNRILLADSHKTAGWCDDCGFEIYGRKWPEMLREAGHGVEKTSWDLF